MSFILEDNENQLHEVQVNVWNWRPTIALLVEAGIIPEGERAERCTSNGCGGHFTQEEVTRTVEFLTALLAKLKPGERVMYDGRINVKPPNYRLPISEWNEQEMWDHYSAGYEWLQMFLDFCRHTKGFTIY